jgi:hypothetical protein
MVNLLQFLTLFSTDIPFDKQAEISGNKEEMNTRKCLEKRCKYPASLRSSHNLILDLLVICSNIL